jgi:hypothetical protein
MPRFFTLAQAELLLPDVERVLREMIALKQEYQESELKIRKATQRIVSLGGSLVDRRQFAADRSRRDSAEAALKDAISRVHEFGCQVKDLDMGLIDFPTRYRGREVLLCWKLGESGIRFWHGLEEGFRGRKPVDDDFLANHRGDDVN